MIMMTTLSLFESRLSDSLLSLCFYWFALQYKKKRMRKSHDDASTPQVETGVTLRVHAHVNLQHL